MCFSPSLGPGIETNTHPHTTHTHTTHSIHNANALTHNLNKEWVGLPCQSFPMQSCNNSLSIRGRHLLHVHGENTSQWQHTLHVVVSRRDSQSQVFIANWSYGHSKIPLYLFTKPPPLHSEHSCPPPPPPYTSLAHPLHSPHSRPGPCPCPSEDYALCREMKTLIRRRLWSCFQVCS